MTLTFQLLLFAPVGSGAPHGLNELDQEGDPLVYVLAAVRASFDSVVVLVDLQSSHNIRAHLQTQPTHPHTPTHTCMRPKQLGSNRP